MKKKELVREISKRIDGATQKDIALILDTFQEVVSDAVKAGEEVKITKFITFYKKHIDAKNGVINLGTQKGERWQVPARDEIAVKVSEVYKNI